MGLLWRDGHAGYNYNLPPLFEVEGGVVWYFSRMKTYTQRVLAKPFDDAPSKKAIISCCEPSTRAAFKGASKKVLTLASSCRLQALARGGAWVRQPPPATVAECPRSFFGCLRLDSSVYRRGGSSARCLPQPQSQRDRSNAQVVPLVRFGKTKVVSQHSNPVFYVLCQTTGAIAGAVLHPKTPPPNLAPDRSISFALSPLSLRLHPFGLRRLPNVSHLPLLCGTLPRLGLRTVHHVLPNV